MAEDEMDNLDWEELEVLLIEATFGPEDIHFNAAALHHIRQLNRCLATLKTSLH